MTARGRPLTRSSGRQTRWLILADLRFLRTPCGLARGPSGITCRLERAADESTCKPDSVPVACATMGGHPSGTVVANGLVRPTRRLGRAALERLRRHRPLASSTSSWPCSGWGLPSRISHLMRWWSLTPPFHPYRSTPKNRPAVCSLWHCPAGHPGWVLPTTLPSGVRTFLDAHFIRTRRDRPVGSSAAGSG